MKRNWPVIAIELAPMESAPPDIRPGLEQIVRKTVPAKAEFWAIYLVQQAPDGHKESKWVIDYSARGPAAKHAVALAEEYGVEVV